MRNITVWLLGYCKIKVCGASVFWFLNRLTADAIPFWNIKHLDEFAVEVSVYKKDLEAAKNAAELSMCHTEKVCEYGLPKRAKLARRRVCLLFLLVASVLVTVVAPRYVWFYDVEGNTSIPAEQIIRAVKQCGVGVGTKGKNIKPSLVKEKVLTKIPELAWLTVTQSGGKATIVVREKKAPSEVEDRRTPKNVIAARAGMITNISVLEGSAVVKKGDVVTKGQLLVSGYMDLEYKYRACAAKGEVYARTWRDIMAVTPQKYTAKKYTEKKKTKIFLCFGRKRIKLSSGSGIFPTGCDKMTREYVVTLPGGLKLPISLVKETYRFYDRIEAAVPETYAKSILQDAAVTQTKKDMVAGVIHKKEGRFGLENGNYTMRTTLECEEMISHTIEAEIFKGEIQHDGTSD